MLIAKVDTDGTELVHILFEKGRLTTIHYTAEPESEDDRRTKVYEVDSQMFTANAASRGSFRLDISEDASETLLLVRIKTDNKASANFNIEGYQGFHIEPGQDQIFVYSHTGGADRYRKM